jgi:hypothetical protein
VVEKAEIQEAIEAAEAEHAERTQPAERPSVGAGIDD